MRTRATGISGLVLRTTTKTKSKIFLEKVKNSTKIEINFHLIKAGKSLEVSFHQS
jgi:hypothetical protein